MRDRVRVRLPGVALYFGRLTDSAFYPLWDGKISTSQRAVMLCSWGVKAGMACLQVKLCVLPYLSALVFKGALQMSRFTLLYLGLGPEDIVSDGETLLPPKSGHNFSAHVYYGQPAGRIKMPLGTEVGLGPGDVVTWGSISSPKRGTNSQISFVRLSVCL